MDWWGGGKWGEGEGEGEVSLKRKRAAGWMKGGRVEQESIEEVELLLQTLLNRMVVYRSHD